MKTVWFQGRCWLLDRRSNNFSYRELNHDNPVALPLSKTVCDICSDYGTESFLRIYHVLSQSRNSRTLWDSEFHYHFHKSPPPVSLLSKINPVQEPHPTAWWPTLILSSHLHEDPFLRFPYLKPVYTSPLSHTSHVNIFPYSLLYS